MTVTCNVADEGQAAAIVERAVAGFGRLDMAYNNAGILGPMGVPKRSRRPCCGCAAPERASCSAWPCLDLELAAAPRRSPRNARGFVQVDAIFPLEPGHPFKGVRVRGPGATWAAGRHPLGRVAEGAARNHAVRRHPCAGQNPNRLSLILDEENTIVEAFWE